MTPQSLKKVDLRKRSKLDPPHLPFQRLSLKRSLSLVDLYDQGQFDLLSFAVSGPTQEQCFSILLYFSQRSLKPRGLHVSLSFSVYMQSCGLSLCPSSLYRIVSLGPSGSLAPAAWLSKFSSWFLDRIFPAASVSFQIQTQNRLLLLCCYVS